jgi:hypothetical protein
LRYAGVAQPAGSRIVYVAVRRHWMEQTIVDGLQERDEHLGVLAVDPERGTARYEQGRVIGGSHGCFHAYDVHGREFYSEFVEHGDDEARKTALLMREPCGSRRVLRTEIGRIGILSVVIEDGAAWVFYLRHPIPEVAEFTYSEVLGILEDAEAAGWFREGTASVPDLPSQTGSRPGKSWGTCAVVRVNVDTGESTYLPFPPPGEGGTWDWLVAQNKDVVHLTGGVRGGQARTWRADFAKRQWDAPIEGNFVVVDAKGTLIERRESGIWARNPGLLPTQAEIIREGKRTTIDLGLPGRVRPIFGSRRVVLFDPASRRYVFRSVNGEPDLWLPTPPPTQGRVRLETK